MKKEKLDELLANAEVFEMPAGYVDENGQVHKEFQLAEMTGADEEAIQKPEIKQNGAKVIRVALTRCVLRIGTFLKSEVRPEKWVELIQELTVGDQDYMMMKLREISSGGTITLNHTCPSERCKHKITTEVDLEELEVIPFSGQRELEFVLPKGYVDKDGNRHTQGKIRFPNGLDRELLDPMARKNLAMANTLLLTRCVVDFDGVVVTEDVMRSLISKDREYLLSLLLDNRFGIDMNFEITCPLCGEEFKGSLNTVNFI